MKLILLNLYLWMTGATSPDSIPLPIAVEQPAYSSKEDIGYSSKSSKAVLWDLPPPPTDVLNRLYMPPLPPLPPIINPPPVTKVNPQ